MVLTPGFAAGEEDSSCLPPVQQFCRLVKTHFPDLQVVIITFQYPFFRKKYRWYDCEVYAMGGKNKRGLLRLITWSAVYHRLMRLRRRQKIVGVLSFWLGETALVGKIFAGANKFQHLIWTQGQDVKPENRYVQRVRPGAGSLIAISAFNAQQMEANHGIRPAHIVPNGVNKSLFPAFNEFTREIDVLGAGSLIPLKNYSAFIRIILELKKKFPHVKAVIAGAGPEERELSDLAFRLGLQHNLKLMGSMPHAALLQLMNNSKTFLHTSTYEGMSTVMLEALYSGCEVVSSMPVSSGDVNRHNLCGTEEEMTTTIEVLLTRNAKPERVLVHDMEDSARQVVALLGVKTRSV